MRPCARDGATAHATAPPGHTVALTEVYADPAVARYIGGAALDAEGAAVQVARIEAVRRDAVRVLVHDRPAP